VLEALVTRLPPPEGDAQAPLTALLVDSWYDPYLGVVILVRVKDGVLLPGQKIRLMATGAVHPIERVGVFTPKGVAVEALGPGEIGFITAASRRRRLPGRRHDYRGPPAAGRTAAGVQAGAAGRLLRAIPHRSSCGARIRLTMRSSQMRARA